VNITTKSQIMDYKTELDISYNKAVEPLKNFPDTDGTIDGVMQYVQLLGDTVIEFAEEMNNKLQQFSTVSPEKEEEIRAYMLQLSDKLISTYRPQ
jgi:hypothetical protein